MNTSIHFPILQIHTTQDADHNTLSKAISVYDKNIFELNNSTIKNSYKKIRIINHIHASKTTGEYAELLTQFTWHLN